MGITSARIIKVLAVYTAVIVSVVTFLNAFSEDVEARAKVLMGFGLVVFWCLGFGLLSRYGRDRFRRAFARVPGPWQVKFIIAATALAMLEEVVTVCLTNAAPLFGVARGQVMITASTNYLEVVFLNSVWPVFVPWIIGWSLLLTRYAFPPNHVFLLFGLLGSLAEMTFGWSAVIAGFWVFVYGLMVYLPAYALPTRDARPPRWWHYPIAVVFPFLCMAPWALVYGGVVSGILGFDLIQAGA